MRIAILTFELDSFVQSQARLKREYVDRALAIVKPYLPELECA